MPVSRSAPTLRDVGISAGRARLHEALVVRLEAMLKDVWRLAAKAPEGTVSEPLRVAAESLLFEAERFRLRGHHQRLAERARLRSVGQSDKETIRLAERARSDRSARAGKNRDALPAPPPTLGALGVVLGQARARLEAFELTRSYWSGKHKAFVWRVGSGPVPIGRLRPMLAAATDALDERTTKQMRDKIMRRIEAREEESYARGYADARNGMPSRPQRP